MINWWPIVPDLVLFFAFANASAFVKLNVWIRKETKQKLLAKKAKINKTWDTVLSVGVLDEIPVRNKSYN